MKFTVLIITYNPIWEKLKITLESVLRQTFRDFEIVISDDGSKDDLSDQIVAYFKEKDFHHYVLVPHEKNQGTVKNLIDGVERASGKYIRDFGPGDFFYNENTLAKLYDFLEKNEYEGCFSLMKGYCVKENGEISYTQFPHPFDLDAYKKGETERILRNLIVYRDNASGACLTCKRDFFLEYLKKLEGTVKYMEDIFQLQAALEGRALKFFPEYAVWYEADAGMSTNKKSKFSELLELDVDNFYANLWEDFSDNRYVKIQHRVSGLYKVKNLYIRTILRTFLDPYTIVYLVRHYMQILNGAYEPSTKEDGFLDKDEFRQIIKGE